MRFLQIGAVLLIPVAAVVLAFTFRSSDPGPRLAVHAQTGSYQATVGTALSVTAFRIANTSKTEVTIKRIRVAQGEPGMNVIGALAYRGCSACIADSSVPPKVTPPPDVAQPKLLAVSSFLLKPGDTITLLLSVRVTRPGSVHVPPLRIDTTGPAGSRTIDTQPGPVLCAGTKGC
jgi:hypothetical protein